jgi:hypothetical protein
VVSKARRRREGRLDWERCLTIIFTSIRIHPGTALARDEKAAGRLAGRALRQRFPFVGNIGP